MLTVREEYTLHVLREIATCWLVAAGVSLAMAGLFCSVGLLGWLRWSIAGPVEILALVVFSLCELQWVRLRRRIKELLALT